MEGNKEAWNEYCTKRKLLKEKIREKRRIQNESNMQSITEVTRKIRMNFGNLYIQNNLMHGSKKKILLLRDDTYNCSVSDTKDKLSVCVKRALPKIRQRKVR